MDPYPARRERNFPVRFLAFSSWDELSPALANRNLGTDGGMARLAMLKLFGFCTCFGYRVAFLCALVVVFLCFAPFLRYFDVYHFTSQGAIFFCFSLIPYLYLGLGPIIFLISLLFCNGGLWRFLSVSVGDKTHQSAHARGLTHCFVNDSWTLKYGSMCFSSFFVAAKIVITVLQGISKLSPIPIVFWSYLVVLLVTTVGVIMLVLRNFSIMIHKIHVMLLRGHKVNVPNLLREVSLLNEAFRRFSRRVSPFLLSLSIIIVFVIANTVAVISLLGSLGHPLPDGSGDSVCLSILIATVYWRLMDAIKKVNFEAKSLETFAKQAYRNARAIADHATPVTSKLKFIAAMMKNSTDCITLYGRPIDTSLTDLIFNTHLAFGDLWFHLFSPHQLLLIPLDLFDIWL